MRYLHRSIKLFLVFIGSFSMTGCDKFLDVTPKGYTLLNTITNYDQWLNDPALYSMSNFMHLIYPADVYDLVNIPNPVNTDAARAYTWVEDYSTTAASLWEEHYQAISSYNSVINGVENATNGTEQQKLALKAEALLGRAFEYFYLVNEYGKSYDSATAATDLAVPIVLSDDVAQTVPPRSTVKEVYDFLIADINTAFSNLPLDNSLNRFRGSRAAAHSLLARVYFYARNYTKAAEYANLALSDNPGQGIVDYTALSSATGIYPITIRQDVLYARSIWSRIEAAIPHLKHFDINDKRLRFFYSPLGNYTFPQRGAVRHIFGSDASPTIHNNMGTTIAEMVLIIGEAAVRNNNLDEALERLHQVRKARIPAANYVRYISTDPEEVLNKLLLERELEFPFNTLRWFDMRRLDSEGKMPSINRLDPLGSVIATLEPNSPRYTFQIPQLVIRYNPDMKLNP